jgi:hypothetical protein
VSGLREEKHFFSHSMKDINVGKEMGRKGQGRTMNGQNGEA